MKPTNIPSPNVPFTDSTNRKISREWYYFLNNYVFDKLGGGGDTSTIPDIVADVAVHETRLDTAESDIDAAQLAITAINLNIDEIESDVATLQGDVSDLQADKEDVANKVTAWTVPTNDTNYPSEKLVYDTVEPLVPVSYYPASLTVSAGTLDTGTYTDLAALGGTNVNISEAVGASPLIATLGFTGVARLSGFAFFGHYVGGAGHQIAIEIYNKDSTAWDRIGLIGTETASEWYSFPIFSPDSYINAGAVSVRFNHIQTGINTHDLILDLATVYFGASAGGTNVSAASVTFLPSGNISATNVGSAIVELDTEKQETLVSGSNIKTINSTSLLGSGDITIIGSGLTYSQVLSLTNLRA